MQLLLPQQALERVEALLAPLAKGLDIVTIVDQAAHQARREWRRTPFREIAQTRWTIVGFGAIGREIARRIRPFGVHLTVVRRQSGAAEGADAVVGLERLPDVLADTDVVVL